MIFIMNERHKKNSYCLFAHNSLILYVIIDFINTV